MTQWLPEDIERALTLAAIEDQRPPADPRRELAERLEALRAEFAPKGLMLVFAIAKRVRGGEMRWRPGREVLEVEVIDTAPE